MLADVVYEGYRYSERRPAPGPVVPEETHACGGCHELEALLAPYRTHSFGFRLRKSFCANDPDPGNGNSACGSGFAASQDGVSANCAAQPGAGRCAGGGGQAEGAA